MNENITINEVQNDGRSIHLYFNGLIGLWSAYGISAFILSKVTTVSASYSDEMQMPVAVLNSAHLDEMKKQLKVVKSKRSYYCLAVEEAIDEEVYEEWASSLRKG